MSGETNHRTPCKYGKDCYQKNPEHLMKYKHPSNRDPSADERGHTSKRDLPTDKRSHPSKKVRTEDNSKVYNQEDSNKIITSDLPNNLKERIKFLFLVEMPNDFYCFYEFCKSISSTSPKNALKILNLELVGPFDVLGGKLKAFTQEDALRHYRYYFDPPEFLTVLAGDVETQLHYGYFRDDPKELPCCVAKNVATVGPTITCVAGNLFGAVNVHAEDVKSSSDIFRKMKVHKLQTALVKWAKKNNIHLDTLTPEIRQRRKKVVAKTFNEMGIVVPYDNKTELGYRSLAVSDDDLKKILKKIASSAEEEKDQAWSMLQPVITAASIANDECDFGTSLELGLDMFAFGEECFHTTIERIMCTTYKLLQRDHFGQILKAHLKHRQKGLDSLSTIV